MQKLSIKELGFIGVLTAIFLVIGCQTLEAITWAAVEQADVTFEMTLGIDMNKLSQEEIAELREIYSEIENYEFAEDGSADDDYWDLMDAYDYKMMEFGLDVPFWSYVEVADKYRDQLNYADYNQIVKLDAAYTMSDDDERLIEKIEAIFDKNDLPGEEITTQVMNRSVQYALFDVLDGQIQLSADSIENSTQLSKDEKVIFKRLWKHIVKIVPRAYMDKLVKFEVNTDGIENVMAHVIEETEDYSKWRLAIDLKDAMNVDGSFSDEFTNTVIHEFAHVMTLHNGELQGDLITDDTAYSTIEGSLKTNSYLNQFYQKFWTDMAEEHAQAEAIDAIDDFYSKYETHFVSDYAATNPAEDIAETYRIFVTESKPEGMTIKEQKVLFMYEYPELVKIRSDIREALALDGEKF